MGERAAAQARDVLHQEGVRRRADADGEQARTAERLADFRQHLIFVADGAVGEEDHLAQAGFVGRRAVDEGCLQRGVDFRAAVGLQVR